MTTVSKRKSVRFKPDLNTLAVVALGAKDSPNYVGLVINESHRGCRAAFLIAMPLQINDSCEIAVGKLAPLKANVVWRKESGNELVELGFAYID